MDASASIYNGFVLRIYDFLVLVFSNYLAWRVSTNDVLVPFFARNIGQSAHLDIGVGTGFYLEKCVKRLQDLESVHLLDMNPSTIQAAKNRLHNAGYKKEIATHTQSIFSSLPRDLCNKFDSVSMFYLLHCLPGTIYEKAESVFENVIPTLKPGGVIYGCTVLGKGVQHNWLGTRLMALYNKKGIFDNYDDDIIEFEQYLRKRFVQVDTKIIGVVMLFEVRSLRQ